MSTQQDRWGSDYIPNDRYQKIRGLERGFEGFCILSKSKRSGKFVVMKYVPCEKKQLPKEAKMLLEELKPHPNTVRAFAAQRDPAYYRRTAIHMEYCTGGALIDQLSTFRALKLETPSVFALHVFIGLTNALAFLHHGIWRGASSPERMVGRHKPIIHCDLKPDNVLLRWRENPECGLPDIVLADFGAAQFEASSWGCDGGTYDYLSPEARSVVDLMVNGNQAAYEKAKDAKILTTKSDMYSLGVMMYLVASWKHWECGKNPQRVRLPEAYTKRPTKEADRDDSSQAFIFGFLHAVVWCLQPDQDNRPLCSYDEENGLLQTMDLLRRQRDAMFKKDGPLPEKIWNVNRPAREDAETAMERYEALSTGSRRPGVGAVDSMMPLRRVVANNR